MNTITPSLCIFIKKKCSSTLLIILFQILIMAFHFVKGKHNNSDQWVTH